MKVSCISGTSEDSYKDEFENRRVKLRYTLRVGLDKLNDLFGKANTLEIDEPEDFWEFKRLENELYSFIKDYKELCRRTKDNSLSLGNTEKFFKYDRNEFL